MTSLFEFRLPSASATTHRSAKTAVKTPSKGFVAAILAIGAAGVSIPFWGRGSLADNPGHTKTGREKQNLASITTAISSYQEELNRDPPASPAQFFSSLRGANPKGYTFLTSSKHADAETGFSLDEWRNHYQIDFRDARWTIRSAGPDRTFDRGEGEDDISVVFPAIQK